MKIISLHNGHDAAITAFEDGQILGHWELERVLNIKHFCGVDHSNEIADVLYNHVLPKLGWLQKDIDILVFAGCTEWRKTEFKNIVPKYDMLNNLMPYAESTAVLRDGITTVKTYSVVHHVNHMAYAYFTSPFNKSLLFSYDGIGDKTSSMAALGIDNKILVTHIFSQSVPIGTTNNGIGLAYSYLGRVFPFLGTDLLATAGKAMGLSSYGKPRDEWRKVIRSVITEWMPKPERLITELNLNKSDLADPMNKVAQDLMATIQDELELYLCETIKALKNEPHGVKTILKDIENLCLSGGCALNVQANTRLLTEKIIKNLYVPPACSDCGISIGAGLFVWHHILDNPFSGVAWHDPYKGDTLYNHPDEIKDFEVWLKQNYPTIKAHKFISDSQVILNAATNLFNNKIIAWAQDRAEIGPRALGNRSILANPCNPDSKDIVNAKVKHREFWRPFAPIVIDSEAHDWFELDHNQPYMLEAPLALKEYSNRIPAVVHVDGTARAQTVSKTTNEKLWLLLKDFKMLKGVGVLLNTSLNDRGRPIANDLKDILNLLRDSELDVAYVGKWRFTK